MEGPARAPPEPGRGLDCGGLADLLEITEWAEAATLAASLWVAFPAILLVGSVIWDDVPPRLAAIHAGDWLMKLVLIAVIVGIWQ